MILETLFFHSSNNRNIQVELCKFLLIRSEKSYCNYHFKVIRLSNFFVGIYKHYDLFTSPILWVFFLAIPERKCLYGFEYIEDSEKGGERLRKPSERFTELKSVSIQFFQRIFINRIYMKILFFI